jgi:hypothetical protein
MKWGNFFGVSSSVNKTLSPVLGASTAFENFFAKSLAN